MMLTSYVPLAVLFLLPASWLTTQATEPSCAGIADFEKCHGDTADFCPKGISCGCKDEIPSCMCPSYRVKWENFWYMGPKCDQLWSTLDLIIISALPALTLAVVVGIVMQWINYCCGKRKKKARKFITPASQVKAQAHIVPDYVPNLADDPKYALLQKGVKAAPNFKFPQISLQYQPDAEIQLHPVTDFSYIPPQPLRKATSVNSSAFENHSRYWGRKMPDVDYEEENPFTAVAMQQFANSGTPAFPRPSYNSPQPANNRNAERGGNPSKFGHPQTVTSGF